MLILVEFIELADSFNRFSSKSFKVIGRLDNTVAVSIPVWSLIIRGLDGVVIIEDEAKGTLLDLIFNFRFNSSESISCAVGAGAPLIVVIKPLSISSTVLVDELLA
jgi:hypothetical protein